MKRLIILALMLRVWWTPAFQKEQSGIVVAGGNEYVIARQDNGNVVSVSAGIIYKSAWEEVGPTPKGKDGGS